MSGEERKRGRREPAVSRARALRRDATESCSLTLKSLVREAIVVETGPAMTVSRLILICSCCPVMR